LGCLAPRLISTPPMSQTAAPNRRAYQTPDVSAKTPPTHLESPRRSPPLSPRFWRLSTIHRGAAYRCCTHVLGPSKTEERGGKHPCSTALAPPQEKSRVLAIDDTHTHTTHATCLALTSFGGVGTLQFGCVERRSPLFFLFFSFSRG